MTIQDIKKYAIENDIPIIKDKVWDILNQCIIKNRPEKILEIGTGTGYSASKIISIANTYLTADNYFTSIEIDTLRYNTAVDNIKALGFYDKAELINDDAGAILGQYVLENRKFDLIFLDGAKGQYINYFSQLIKILEKNGILFCDNLTFHGISAGGANTYHKMRTIAVNLQKFQKAIMNSSELNCCIYPIGDDKAAICTKK